MKFYTVVLSFLLIAAAVNGDDENTNTTLAPTTPTTLPTTTLPTTTPKPTTTTPKPTTTTLKPTTSSTTTLAPPTTTLKPTTPTPTDIPNPPTVKPVEKQSFEVKEGDKICILLDFSCQFAIPYTNLLNKNVTAEVNVGANASVDTTNSFCSRPTMGHKQRITVIWDNNSLGLTFINESTKFYVDEINLTYFTDPEIFPGHPKPNAAITVNTVNLTTFSTSKSRSYKCKAEEDVKLNNKIVMSVSNLQVEAYRTQNTDSKFSLAEVCSKDDKTSNIVPIAVGCALAALVLIVLIAYCIGRRRSRQKGYQSV